MLHSNFATAFSDEEVAQMRAAYEEWKTRGLERLKVSEAQVEEKTDAFGALLKAEWDDPQAIARARKEHFDKLLAFMAELLTESAAAFPLAHWRELELIQDGFRRYFGHIDTHITLMIERQKLLEQAAQEPRDLPH